MFERMLELIGKQSEAIRQTIQGQSATTDRTLALLERHTELFKELIGEHRKLEERVAALERGDSP